MHTITATLILDDTADPPRAAVSIQVDGEVVAAHEHVSPADSVAALDAFAQGDEELRSRLRLTVASTISRLQEIVEKGHEAQLAREAALSEWQLVLDAGVPAAAPDA
ncbi:hypothetical protein DSM104299_00998 [Baekduia alba]|uniref:hypothetical protein n=1 Tax=Baekduia alba TaxID=2997333 RepID=UPI0023426BB5|nr:hypothetical protein [Baekduia alba]WCB92308.1 hypothetical protein DSM104299_00998 [Baekduia alba]